MTLLDLSAHRLVDAVRRGDVTVADVLDVVEDRMSRVEPLVNAVPVVALDRARARRPPAGSLTGVPVTVKDVLDVAGLPTTYGSEPYRDAVPTRTDPLVGLLERRGALIVGKTNVPEFLSGADTVNSLFGRTRNPWDPALSCGASSGGAAVSVATGTSWCAHAEDTAGSIRIPAAFCGVVGLRPTPGLVVTAPVDDPVPGFAVHGPIARDVTDAATLLSAMLPTGAVPPAPWVRRLAFSTDLGGAAVTDPEIAAICTRAATALEDLGYRCTPYAPPVGDAHEACLTLLAHRAAVLLGPRVDRHGDRIGPAVHAEVEAGRALTPGRVRTARRVRADVAARVRAMFADHGAFVVPTFGRGPWRVAADASPFPSPDDLPGVAAAWPLTTLATMAGCPALTVPCGRTAAGHPVGLQIIGPPHSDAAVLRIGHDVEVTSGNSAGTAAGTVSGVPVTPVVPAC